jgi:hypothetical protein
MTIDAYLAELERRLSWTARRRALPEVKEHLRDAAARHREAGASPFDAEEAATRDFGPPHEVARRVDGEFAVRETRIASLLALGAVLAFVFPLYVIPENTLGPATWPEVPAEILALQRASIALWLVSGTLAAVSVVLAWTRWLQLAAHALLATALAITAASAAGSALALRWIQLSPTTPNWALSAAFAALVLCACVLAALWTRSTRRRLLAAA